MANLDPSSTSSSILQPWNAANLARVCCPFPRAKFLDLRSSWSLARTTTTSFRAAAAAGQYSGVGMMDRDWLGTGRALTLTLPTRDVRDEAIWTITGHFTLRGMTSQACPPHSSGVNPFLPLSTRTPRDRSLATLLQQDLPRSLRSHLLPHRTSSEEESAATASCFLSIIIDQGLGYLCQPNTHDGHLQQSPGSSTRNGSSTCIPTLVPRVSTGTTYIWSISLLSICTYGRLVYLCMHNARCTD